MEFFHADALLELGGMNRENKAGGNPSELAALPRIKRWNCWQLFFNIVDKHPVNNRLFHGVAGSWGMVRELTNCCELYLFEP